MQGGEGAGSGFCLWRRERGGRTVGEKRLRHIVFNPTTEERLLLQCGAECCSVVQSVAVWGSVVQCGAVWCRVVQSGAVCCSVLQCVAVCCSVLQCVAVCCSVLQCVALFAHAAQMRVAS